MVQKLGHLRYSHDGTSKIDKSRCTRLEQTRITFWHCLETCFIIKVINQIISINTLDTVYILFVYFLVQYDN